jgi:hypothetical protein
MTSMAEDIAEKMRTEAYLLRDQLSILTVVNSVRKALIEGAEEIDQLRAKNVKLREQLDIARLALSAPMLGDIPP